MVAETESGEDSRSDLPRKVRLQTRASKPYDLAVGVHIFAPVHIQESQRDSC